jgi:RHS repeat-associated protein
VPFTKGRTFGQHKRSGRVRQRSTIVVIAVALLLSLLHIPPATAASANVAASEWQASYGGGLAPASWEPRQTWWYASASYGYGTFNVGTAAFAGQVYGYFSGYSPAENEPGGSGTLNGTLSGYDSLSGSFVDAPFEGVYTRSSSSFDGRIVATATLTTGSTSTTGTVHLRVHGPWGVTQKYTDYYGWTSSASMTLVWEEAEPLPNSAPGAPTLVAPTQGTVFQPTDTQRFSVRSTDPDATPYKARITVTKQLDRTTTSTTTTTLESAYAASGQDAHAVPTASLPRGTYTWSAVATDAWGASSGPSATGTFSVGPFVDPVPPQADGPTTMASVTTTGGLGDDGSDAPSVSADGRYVAFESWATNLVPGDTNDRGDIFVRDRGTGVTTRVSVTSSGGQSSWASYQPSISADGRFVAFESYSPTLVPGDANGTNDVFVHDRASGTTSLVSLAGGGAQGNGWSQEPAISGNGRYVAFRSGATNLVGGDTNNQDDVFVRDLHTGTTTRASIGNVGQEANYGSWEPAISENGRYVAFVSWSMNLINSETNFNRTIYLRDTAAGTTSRVSVAAGGGLPDGHSDRPVITPDGRWVGYSTRATNLVSSDTSINEDVVLYDRQTGTNHLASVNGAGNGSFGTRFSMSADARYVAFVQYPDVVVRDRTLGLTRTVSQDSWGLDANSGSGEPAMSADGRWVMFSSSASNLVHGDTNLVGDVFAYDTTPERDCIGEGTTPGLYTPVGCVTGYGAHATSSRLGLEDWMPYRSWDLGPGTAYANMANGNLVVQHADVDAPGQGLNLRMTRTYNLQGATTPGPLGKGWRLGVADGDGLIEGLLSAVTSVDIGRVVGIVGSEDQFDFIDADGTKHHFIKGGLDGPGWHSPPGLNMTLSDHIDGVGQRYYKATRPDGVRYEFRPVALNYFLTKIADRKGNHIDFNYTGGTSPVLSSITDTSGRSLVLTWSGNHVSNIRYNADGGWLDTSYNVVDGTLRSVTEAAGTGAARTTNYSYDANDRLTSVTDPRGHATTFGLAASNQLTRVTDRESKPWNLVYNNALSCVPSVGAGTNVVCLVDPENQVTTWTTNVEGNLVHRRDEGDAPDGAPPGNAGPRRNDKQWAWGDNRLLREMDESGSIKEYAYNANGQVTEVRDTGSGEPTVVTRLAYSDVSPGVADLASVRAAFGTAEERVTGFAHNADGTLASTTDAEGKSTSFTYYGRGLLKTVTDANNKTTTYGNPAAGDGEYHSSGQPRRIVDATGQAKHFAYDFLGRNTQVTDRTGKVWNYDYDLHGNRTREVTPLGHATVHCFDANGNETLAIKPKAVGAHCGMSEADPYVTRRAYDKRDLLTAVVTKSDSQLRKTAYTLAPDGEVAEVLEPRSFDGAGNLLPTVQKVVYDRFPNNRIAGMVDEEGHRTDVVYTPDGLHRTVTKPAGAAGRHTTTYTYNSRDEVTTQLELGHSQPTTHAYNAHGEKVSTKSPKGATTTFVYDKMGRVTRTVDGNGKLTRRAYDNVGNLLTLATPKDTGGELVTNYTYTPRNEIDTETDPTNGGHLIDYDYDGEGRQRFRHDRANGAIVRTLEQTYLDDGKQSQKIASAAGTTAGRHVSTWAYDANGNTIGVTAALDGAASPNVSSITAGYTTADEPATWSETLWTAGGTAVTKASSWAYLPDGLVSSRTADGQTTSYSSKRNGWEEATTPWGGAGSLGTEHYADGSVKRQTLPGGTTVDQSFDAAERLTSRIVTKAGGAVLSAWDRIAWDDDDNRLAEQVRQLQTDNTTVKEGSGTYGYDTGGRMTQAKHPFEDASVAYALDDAGNIVTEADFRYSYSNNKLVSRQALPVGTTSSYGHDLYGNQVSEATGLSATNTTYDAASHSRRVTSPDGTWVEYAYDGFDRMVRRQTNGGEVTLFFHDGTSSQIALEWDGAGAGTVKTRYVLAADSEPVANETVGTGGRGWYIQDPRGNVAQHVDNAGSVKGVFAYDPFGKEKPALTSKASGWDSRLRFQTSPRDPKTGMYTLGPRLFDPKINRFVGADHYAASAANMELALDPLTGNRYLYAGANPANLIDDGHAPCDPKKGNWLERRRCNLSNVANGARNWARTNVSGEGIANFLGEVGKYATYAAVGATLAVVIFGTGGTAALALGLVATGAGVGQAIVGGRWGHRHRRAYHIGSGLLTATTGMLSGFPAYGGGRIAQAGGAYLALTVQMLSSRIKWQRR